MLHNILLVFVVSHIRWRRIKDQVPVLQASEIKHGHVQILCMLLVD